MNDSEAAENEGMNGQTTIKSLETTFSIVESMKELDGGRITDLASHTGVAKSTVHKHLATLVKEGYAVKNDEEYSLGFRFLDIGGHVRSEFLSTSMIKPKMQELAEKTGETAQFMTEQNGRAIVLYREAGQQSIPSRTRAGKQMYLHQTASGKAILSRLSDQRVQEILDEQGLPRATESTIVDREGLLEELAEIRETGLSYSYSEATKGLYAIGAPVIAPDDTVLGACAVSGPSHRMRGEPMDDEFPSIVLSIVNEIELRIAYS